MPKGPLYYNAEIQELGDKRYFKPLTETLYKRILRAFKVGQKVVISVEPLKKRRSSSQNNYYWLYLSVIAEETGENEDNLHEYFKRVFITPKFITVLGQDIKIPKSTTDLSKGEFVEYLQKIQHLTDVPLPDPEAAGYIPH